MLPLTTATLTAILAITFVGTGYSILNDSALDTSNPILAHVPRTDTSAYFAQKHNVLNLYFVKKAWGWTSALFFALYFTSPPELVKVKRIGRWAASTLVWALFTSWFFGPGLFDRLNSLSGGKCVVHIPSHATPANIHSHHVVVPDEFCRTRPWVSPSTHPSLFTDPSILAALSSTTAVGQPAFRVRPRLYHGHDVSGHLFLLTLSALFLADQITPSLPLVFPSLFSYARSNGARGAVSKATPLHVWTSKAAMGLMGLWMFMAFTTSVYFHTPAEKISGLAMGVAGYFFTKVLVPSSSQSGSASKAKSSTSPSPSSSPSTRTRSNGTAASS